MKADFVFPVLIAACLVAACFIGCGDSGEGDATPSPRTKITLYSGGQPIRVWRPERYYVPIGESVVYVWDNAGDKVIVAGSFVIERE